MLRRRKGSAVRKFSLLCIWLSLAVTASAQTSNHNRDFDPLHQFNSAVRKLVSNVTPSVVQVLATGYGPVESGSGNSTALVGMQQKIGSGVIIDPDGYIVTNAHVVGGAQHVRVSVPIIATNESTDEPIISRSRLVDARVVGSDVHCFQNFLAAELIAHKTNAVVV
jgi:serine protease Do